MYQYDQKPGTRPSDESVAVLQQIRDSEYSVLVGRNNCGKSFLLKTLTQQWGQNASYLGPARYQNFNLLGFYTPKRNKKNEKWNQFIQHWQQQQQNIDNSPVNLQQAIAELSDEKRESLAEIVYTLLGVKLEIRLTVEDNSMSQKYISCGGHNISYTSSGLRLITTLVTSLLDTDYDTFLIDEPELGISPEAQGVLADFLFDRTHRQKYFPHIKTIVFATHSTIFLDRAHITNNYTVDKNGDEINIKRVETQMDFNDIHFFLLGNRFEALYLPSAIVLVEGKSDHSFIERVFALRYPGNLISVVPAHSDSRIKEILNVAKGLFADLQKSPYKDRIFVLLDSVHSAGLPQQLTAMGIPQEHIIKWPKNGIEYYYPPSIINKIFGNGPEIQIDGDTISRNGISHTKADLAAHIASLLDSTTPMHVDFSQLFLAPLEAKLG
jgi:predicted ATP-dependent endonuclease of OLD family